MTLTRAAILNLTDFTVLNAYTLNESGLYEGKAGHALCLFEMARYLDDDRLENHALEILKEALVTRMDSPDFRFGLGGIGYTLLYLIRNGFLNADFKKLFGNRQEGIFREIESSQNRFVYLDILPFLLEGYKHGAFPESAAWIQSILDDALNKSDNAFSKETWHQQGQKNVWIDFLRSFFKSLLWIEYRKIPVACDASLLQKLADDLNGLIRSNLIQLPADVLFYMRCLPMLNIDCGRGAITVDPVISQTMNLTLITRLNVMRSYAPESFVWPDNPLPLLSDDTLEHSLDFRIGRNYPLCSFYGGIPRFLLYCIFCDSNSSQEDRERLAEILI